MRITRKTSTDETTMMREATSKFFDFGADFGVEMHKVALKWRLNPNGKPFLFFCASEEISKDEVLLQIPESIVLSPRKVPQMKELASITGEFPQIFASGDRFVNQAFLLILLVLFELNKGPEGKFWLYFEMVFLTNDLDFIEEDNLKFIKDPFTSRFMRTEMRKFERMFELFQPVLKAHIADLGSCDWPLFKKVSLLVVSRYFVNEFNELMLVPFFDLMNHSNEGVVSFSQREHQIQVGCRKLSFDVNNSENSCEVSDEIEESLTTERKSFSSTKIIQGIFEENSGSEDSGYGSNYSEDEDELDEFNGFCEFNNATCDSVRNFFERSEKEELCGIRVYSTSREPIKRNQEICISYGRRSNFFLLVFYGFVLQKNRYNHFRFLFDSQQFRKDMLRNNKNNYCGWTNPLPCEGKHLFKFKSNLISFEFLEKLRECFGFQQHRSIAIEKIVVTTYYGFFVYFASIFEQSKGKPENEFQMFAETNDALLADIVTKQKQISARLLDILKRVEQNPRFNVNSIESYVSPTVPVKEKMEILQSLRALKKYFTQAIDPLVAKYR